MYLLAIRVTKVLCSLRTICLERLNSDIVFRLVRFLVLIRFYVLMKLTLVKKWICQVEIKFSASKSC